MAHKVARREAICRSVRRLLWEKEVDGCCGKKRGRGLKEQERAREKGNGCGRAAARAELARMLDN